MLERSILTGKHASSFSGISQFGWYWSNADNNIIEWEGCREVSVAKWPKMHTLVLSKSYDIQAETK